MSTVSNNTSPTTDILIVDWQQVYINRRRKCIRDAEKFLNGPLLDWAKSNGRVFELLEIDRDNFHDSEFQATGQCDRCQFWSSAIPPSLVNDRFFKTGQSPNETLSKDGRRLYTTGKFRTWLKSNKISKEVLLVGVFLDQCILQTASVLTQLGYNVIIIREGCVPSMHFPRARHIVERLVRHTAFYRNLVIRDWNDFIKFQDKNV